MAKVTIVLADSGEDDIDLQVDFEPAIDTDKEDHTPAQNAAIFMMNALRDKIDSQRDKSHDA